MTDHFTFDGQTVLVTGAGHGLGRAIAHEFAARGASVWAADINEAGLAETAATAPAPIATRFVDVADRAQVQDFAAAALTKTGRIDVLVNDAGGVCGQVGRPIETVTEADWNRIFAVNATGSFLCAQAVVPAMKARGYGRIVNISSGAGLGVSLTGIQAYAAAKAAQIGLTRQLAHELGRDGITVNSVAPGFVRSNPTTERQWESYGPDGQKALIERIATHRLGAPADIAYGVMFFASAAAGWITGQTLSVDGGK
ncbi:MAG: short-chain dehydrogenase [Rhodospirillales bacterium]|nr:short-chain dehydrogenase [Rhodospirillales bacterium]